MAEKLGYVPRHVQVWCRASYAFEIIDWDETSGYRLRPEVASVLLDPSDPQYCGGRIQFYAALHEDFRAFPRYMTTGDTWPRSAHDPWVIKALMNLSKPDAAILAEQVIPQVRGAADRLRNGGTLLDIGPGGGFALVKYASHFPRARIVGLEIDAPSIALATETVREAGLADRVELRQGDANLLEDTDAYDVVTMNITLHETGGPAEYRNVLSRVLRALQPGGGVLVSELPYPDSPGAYRDSWVYRLLAGVQIHETVVGCGMITQGQLGTLLREAGFVDARVADQPLATRFVMIAEKGTVR